MTDWTKVEDALPEVKPAYKNASYDTSAWMLIYNGYSVNTGKYEGTFKQNKMRWVGPMGHGITVTHWMPYPDPPNGSKP